MISGIDCRFGGPVQVAQLGGVLVEYAPGQPGRQRFASAEDATHCGTALQLSLIEYGAQQCRHDLQRRYPFAANEITEARWVEKFFLRRENECGARDERCKKLPD